MTSRLDRLFVLLEAGAGAATRRAAARQLGEIQKAHPEELHRLLTRLMKHLRSPAWETRVAASQAVEAILSNVPEWHPSPLTGLKGPARGRLATTTLLPESGAKQLAVFRLCAGVPDTPRRARSTFDLVSALGPDRSKKEKIEVDSTRLRCETFNIEKVLEHGSHLMGSEGHEYDFEEEALPQADMKERLARQRQQLNARLGLDVASKLGVDISSVYTNDDLCPVKVATFKTEAVRRPVQELVQIPSSKPLSSREMNLAKRKARQAFCKQKSRDCSEEPSTPPAEPVTKKIKIEPTEDFVVENSGPVPDCSGAWGESSRWPLEGWSGALQAQLFGAAWEARHGAATALRELLRARISTTAGYHASMTEEQMEDAHQEWLEDMALRLLCVLALDRFGDFVSDQVVAPVRETCAQTLGVALAQMRADRVRKVAKLLSALAKQPQWEARHGALLGFKYLLAAREEVACESGALEHLISGLGDAAEDVSAVAAGALAPAAAALANARPEQLPCVVSRLWQLLHDQDDLASPANSYMALLASLMALPQAAKLLHPIDLTDILPRLWPYLDHSTSSVRKATLQTLRTLTRPLVIQSPPQNGDSNGSLQETSSDNSENHKSENSENKIESEKNKCENENSKCVVNGINKEYLNWTPELLQEAMRYVYQRVLFEHVHEIQEIAIQVWENFLKHGPLSTILLAACPLLATWLCLAMQPAKIYVDPSMLLQPPPKERRTRTSSQCSTEGDIPPELRPNQKWYLGGSEAQATCVRDRNVMRARTLAASMLGHLSCYLVQPAPGIEYKTEEESPIHCYVKVMVVYLRSGSALQRLVSSLVISAWARHTLAHALYPPLDSDHKRVEPSINTLAPPLLTSTIHTALNQALYYDEVAITCNRLLQEARDLHAMMKHYKLPVDGEEFNNILRLEQVAHLTSVSQAMVAAMKSKRVSQTLEERRKSLHQLVGQCSVEQNTLNVSVQAALAGACANLHCLPEKLNPVVRPLMESIKKECSEELQANSAESLAVLLDQLAGKEPCPNNKVLINLKAFLRCDPDHTPRISLENTEDNGESASDSGNEGNSNNELLNGPALDKNNGILTLWEQQRVADRGAPRRGRPPTAQPQIAFDQLFAQEDEPRKLLRIQRRGASLALTSLTKYFGDALPEKLPKLWDFITEPFAKIMTDSELETLEVDKAEELVSRLQVLEVVCPHIGGGIWPQVAAGAKACATLTRCVFTGVRHMAARALAAMAARDPVQMMHTVINELIPALGDVRSDRMRCGAAEAIARCVDALQLRVVPYIVLLVVPLMGRMSDHCEAVRVMSTRCFASLIQLMPLDGAIPEPAGLDPEMRARRQKDKHFLEQLFNPRSIKNYTIPVPVAAQLRSYQQAGVNWLRFLYEYKLHGVLCDDMGLGKTLQSLVVVGGSHWERAQQRAPALPSLVVCPPTLTGHWVFEVNKFIPKFLKPLQYVGPPVERERLRSLVKYYNLVVASYDIVRKDIDFFSKIKWNYCILDEGHVIKNGKTKAFQAIKQLVANHRLILSGTPIQNNVLELWSLFDFLMPGLLGTERQFTARYSRPILAARDARATPHHLQAGALACEALHRQVLPFLLRRVKEDVLKELPPKITQDYYCELSPLQRRLYEHFSKSHDIENTSSHTHVFQALHYLQNVCNHPKLVLTGEHPEAATIQQQLQAQHSSLDDIEHSAKLPALKQLLLDCGIGATNCSESEVVVSQHRALIFCQLKKMLDIVEKDLLQKHMPSVTYLRLDGGVPPAQRHAIVTRFNGDVSIDVLLLTTQVGGLGLNLTGADTVIFVEHDWNPMKDLQAMDRAHRIGQKKVVNVYRLITRDTLEEKIMGLQKFKLQTANTVISSENAAMETMGTDQLLDLFQLSSTGSMGPGAGGSGPSTSQTPANSVLETLPDLWDDKQYEEEYDMTNFIKSLNKMNS